MAIATSYNFRIVVNSIDMSDHCIALRVNTPQTANEAQAAGNVHKIYRAGMGDPSIEATFRADDAVGNVNQTLRALITPLSTGVSVTARRLNSARSSANPEYTAEMIVSGDLMAMDDSWGEVPQITVRLVPVGSFTQVVTTT
jgi:hypothetical protein